MNNKENEFEDCTHEFCTKATILLRLEKVEEEYKMLTYLRKEILTLSETSKLLSLSKSTLYKLTSKNEIPFYVPFGKLIYFRKSEIEQWIFHKRNDPTSVFQHVVDNYLVMGEKP